MKKTGLLLLLVCSLTAGHSQPLSLGYLGGMGFSDYHGNYASGRWQSQGSALSAIFLRYNLTPVFSVGTEIGYSRQEYMLKYSAYYFPYYYYDYLSSYYDPRINYYSPYYSQSRETWSYDFLRIPLYITLSTPTKLQLSVSAGVYLSFRTSKDYSGTIGYPYYAYMSSLALYPALGDADAPRHDNGLWYSASLSYPLTPEFQVYAQTRMAVGQRTFIASKTGRTGMSEFAFGLAYTGFSRHEEAAGSSGRSDTSMVRFRIIPKLGMGVSWVRNSDHPESYNNKTSGTVGIQLEYQLDRNFSLVSGLGFARKGYSFSDSSANNYFYALYGSQLYKVDTKVDLDYAVIPLLLKLRMGSGIRGYMEAGIYGGFNLNDRVTGASEITYAYETSYQKQEITVYDNLEGEVHDFELGWVLGAGIEIPAGNLGAVMLGVEYTTGGKNILETNEDRDRYLNYPDNGIRNGFLNIQLGMVIPLTSQK
jgi:hypothetical protein